MRYTVRIAVSSKLARGEELDRFLRRAAQGMADEKFQQHIPASCEMTMEAYGEGSFADSYGYSFACWEWDA